MKKFSRRVFFRRFGLPPRLAKPTSRASQEPNESQAAPDEKHTSEDTPSTFQFILMILFAITTVGSVLFAINKIYPKESLTVALITAWLGAMVYRRRIRATIGAKNYETAARALEHVMGAIGGAMVGGLLALILAIFARVPIGMHTFVGGGFVGGIVGAIYPRVALAICSLIP